MTKNKVGISWNKKVPMASTHKMDLWNPVRTGFPKVTFHPEKVMTKRLQIQKKVKKNGSETELSKIVQKITKKMKNKKRINKWHFTIHDDFSQNRQKSPKMEKMVKNVIFRGVIFYYKTLCFYEIFSD